MSISEAQVAGTIYSDERLSVLTEEAKVVLEQYTNKLLKLATAIKNIDRDELLPDGAKTQSAWQEWEFGLRQFYKELINDAFVALNIKKPEGMEVHFAGSLAKAQATEYSDLDAFVILKNDTDTEQIQDVFKALNNVCMRIFTQTNQLYPDPIGINPGVLIGTVDELAAKIKDNVADPEATARSVISSKPIYPRYALGEQLREKIRENPVLGKVCTPQALYNKAITDFTAPKDNAKIVNIKAHVMRPIDFILMGLREELSLYSEDGAHLSAPGTIRLLRERADAGQPSLPNKEQIDLIESVYDKAMAKRFALHSNAKKEHDDMPPAEAQEMLADVAKLRVMAAERVAALNAAELKMAQQQDPTATKPQTEGFFSRNAETFRTIGVISLIVLVAVGVGVGLAMGGILAVPFAAAAGAAVVGAAAIGYGLFKAGQAISNWIQSKNNESAPGASVESAKGATTEPSVVHDISPGLRGLGTKVEPKETASDYSLAQEKNVDPKVTARVTTEAVVTIEQEPVQENTVRFRR